MFLLLPNKNIENECQKTLPKNKLGCFFPGFLPHYHYPHYHVLNVVFFTSYLDVSSALKLGSLSK